MQCPRRSRRHRHSAVAVALIGGSVLAIAGSSSRAQAADVGTEAALRAAFADPDETLITLTADIAISDCGAGSLTRTSSTDLTLEGAGHEISMVGCPGPRLFTNAGSSTLTIRDTTLTGAAATEDGGAVWSSGPVLFEGCTLTGNTSAGDGGAVYGADDVSVVDCFVGGNGSGTDGQGHGGVVYALGEVSMTRSAAQANDADGHGGAVLGVEGVVVSSSSFTGNTARTLGGAVSSRLVQVTDSVFTGNESTASGGGAVSVSDRLDAVGSTFVGNRGGTGGAIITQPGGANTAIVTLANSTVTGNTATRGGGISAVVTELRHSTVSGNTAVQGGNVDVQPPYLPDGAHGLTTFGSVIVDPLGDANCFQVFGSLQSTSEGHNFTDDESCLLDDPMDVVGDDPRLATLAGNGGPTPTMLPLPGSPLIDVIPAASCGEQVDQRAVARPAGGWCDIGAVEVASATPVAVADAATFVEDAPAALVDVLANDSDADPNPSHSTLRVTSALTTSDQGGAIIVSPGGTNLTYRPPADFAGADTFTYAVADPQGHAATALVTITVTPVDDPPVAIDDAITVVEGQHVTFDPVANDRDVEGDALFPLVVSGPASGTVTCEEHTCTYTPAPGFSGADQFVYAAEQAAVASASVTAQAVGAEPSLGTVVITVVPAPPDTTPSTSVAPTDPPTIPPTAPPPTAPVASLPATGSAATSVGVWALLVLAVGVVLAASGAVARRPRRRSTST